jgi:hypothetical protein
MRAGSHKATPRGLWSANTISGADTVRSVQSIFAAKADVVVEGDDFNPRDDFAFPGTAWNPNTL